MARGPYDLVEYLAGISKEAESSEAENRRSHFILTYNLKSHVFVFNNVFVYNLIIFVIIVGPQANLSTPAQWKCSPVERRCEVVEHRWI